MRVSTGMIYDSSINAISKQTSTFLQLNQQISSGHRMVTPADDPVAAAQVLQVQQSQDITKQYTTNQSYAKSALGLSDSTLTSVTDLLTRVRQLAVYGGNGSLTAGDRQSIVHELSASFDQLIGLANSTDGTGQYLFSGYKGDTIPFAGSVANGVTYAGDSGQRLQQASASRQVAVSDAGNDVFQRIPSGNGYFSTNYSATNSGTGVIGAGSVTDPATWSALANKNIKIQFYVDSTPNPPVTYYDVIDTTANKSLLTGIAPVASPATGWQTGLQTYTSGQSISIPNAGAQVTLTGSPASGDSFTIAPSTSQDVFKTLSNLINALSNPQDATPAGQAALSNQIGFALTNLDQASNNMLRVRSLVGSRLNEIDALGNTNSALSLQYKSTLSNLQDIDYATAISDLARNQTSLTAAQKTFQLISQLSLFNYLP
jgi:flagellar hook-associated protein 3 FlgL